jgi:peptidoglycan/xylan/chitin deacetylase (PgdA/CDA1 family)
MDGLIKNEKIIYNRIISRISPGSIILMHDTSIQSVRVLERVLEYIKDNNYNVVTLEELLNINAYES